MTINYIWCLENAQEIKDISPQNKIPRKQKIRCPYCNRSVEIYWISDTSPMPEYKPHIPPHKKIVRSSKKVSKDRGNKR